MVWLIGNKGMLGSDIESLLKAGNIEFVASDREVDITNEAVLQEFAADKKISWIINCSAYTAVDKAEDEADLCYKINRDGVRNIAFVADKIGAKVVHISTDYVFDGKSKKPLTEDDTPSPVSVYGKSKLAGEDEIKNITRKYFIIRTAWLYGKNGNNFVYTMLRLFNERDTVKVVNDQHGTPTYTIDLASLIINIIKTNSDKYGVYHFSNEGDITWFDFASKIYEMAKGIKLIRKDVSVLPITTDAYPTKAVRPAYSLLDKSKVKNTFGYDVKGWEESLYDFLKVYKSSI